jgi:eukaryotic-like serine/threonine-protein kinase
VAPPPATALPPGTQLVLTNGQWTVDGPLPGASGGFGVLYIVDDSDDVEAVAKFVQKDQGADRELLIGAAINAAGYANVVPVLDHGEHDDQLVLVMPRADTNLADYLGRLRAEGEGVDTTCEGLSARGC